MQAAWPEHKQAHKAGPHAWAYVVQRGRGRSFAMPPFNWTGSLRPTMVSPRREVPASIPRQDYAETGVPVIEIQSKQQSISASSAHDLCCLMWRWACSFPTE